MKKKIALLLAGAMTMSSLPVNVFANAYRAVTRLSSNPVSAPARTAFVEPGARLLERASGEVNNHDDVDYWTRGMYFNVELPRGGVEAGSQFEVVLRNAEWFFDGGTLNTNNGNVNLLQDFDQWQNGRLEVAATEDTVGYELTVNPNRTTAVVRVLESYGNGEEEPGPEEPGEPGPEEPGEPGPEEPGPEEPGPEEPGPEEPGPEGLAYVTTNSVVATNSTIVKGTVRIPLVVRTINEEDASVHVGQTSGFNAETDRRVFAFGTQEGSTTTRIANPQTSRNSLEISPIAISENRIGALPVNGAFEIQAPSGFRFTEVRGKTAGLRTTGGFGNQDLKEDVTLNQNGTTISARYSGLDQSTGVPGALAVHGFQLVPNNVDTVREGDVYLNIRSVRHSAGYGHNAVTGDTVTAQRFLAGTIADWDVNLSVVGSGDVPELINGRLDGIERSNVNDDAHKAATVRFEESVEDAWWATRTTTFTLPEGVRVRQLEFDRIRNIRNDEELAGTFHNDRNRNTSYVRINDNVITLTGLDSSTTGRASFDMNLWLNVESGFTGDIELTVGGSAVTGNNRNDDDQTVVIATAIDPIKLNTEVTNVRVGYQFIPVGNFTITETVPGALLENEQVFVSITDDTFTDMYIAQGFNWEVTEGDLRIRNMRTGTNLNLNNNNNRNNVNVSFEIERESTRASVIEFSNVQVRMSNNAPISSQDAGYDLVVWGPAVAANFEGVRPANDRNVDREHDDYINSNDFFRTAGIRANYINVGSSTNLGTNVVRVTEGSNIIVVGDQEMSMDTAAYVSSASDSMMVPVRFVSMALGIPERNVMWSPETSTVTINAGETILQFQTNSSVMRINGIEVPILNANGEAVQSEVRDERAFIPFRALGEALNIFVDWDSETSTAIFNPARHPENSLFSAAS